MNTPAVPIPPQFHTMYDGSKAINQNEQVSFNGQVSVSIQAINSNVLELNSKLADFRIDFQQMHDMYKHFYKFVETIHPDVLKEYVTSLAVQARLEQSNDRSDV